MAENENELGKSEPGSFLNTFLGVVDFFFSQG